MGDCLELVGGCILILDGLAEEACDPRLFVVLETLRSVAARLEESDE